MASGDTVDTGSSVALRTRLNIALDGRKRIGQAQVERAAPGRLVAEPVVGEYVGDREPQVLLHQFGAEGGPVVAFFAHHAASVRHDG